MFDLYRGSKKRFQSIEVLLNSFSIKAFSIDVGLKLDKEFSVVGRCFGFHLLDDGVAEHRLYFHNCLVFTTLLHLHDEVYLVATPNIAVAAKAGLCVGLGVDL